MGRGSGQRLGSDGGQEPIAFYIKPPDRSAMASWGDGTRGMPDERLATNDGKRSPTSVVPSS